MLLAFTQFTTFVQSHSTFYLVAGRITGWEKTTSGDWLTLAGLIIFIFYTNIIFLILRKPLLYFNRSLSMLLDITMIIAGIFSFFSVSKIAGILGASFGALMLIRTISGKETLAQQIIVQIYRLPALLQTFVSSDQRRLALAIGLGQIHQNLTSLQREELIKYLVERHEPSVKEKVINGLKFVLGTFFLVLLIESPASYIFDRIMESFQNK